MLFMPPEMVDQAAPYRSRVSPVRCALADKMPSLATFRTRAQPLQQQQQQRLPPAACQAPRQLPPLAAMLPCHPGGQHLPPNGQQTTAPAAVEGLELPFQVDIKTEIQAYAWLHLPLTFMCFAACLMIRGRRQLG